MKFRDLSIKEKAAVIKLGVGGGLHTLQDIAQFWDGMGGPDDPPEWKALKNIRYNVYPDTAFTREKTGVGDIDVFDKTDSDTLTYPNGYSVINPYPGQNTIIYNPKVNDEQDIRLDALHFMPQDEVYDALNTIYRYYASGDIYDDAKSKHDEDIQKYGFEYMPLQRYMNNEADAKLRNHLIQGSREYIESKNYYPDKQQLRKDDYFLVPYIDEIQKYLETGVRPKYILPEVTVTPDEYKKGGSIHIKPANKGKFNATKKRTGKTTEELTHSKNPLTRKRAIFAQNARKWHHKHPDGGYLDKYDFGHKFNVNDYATIFALDADLFNTIPWQYKLNMKNPSIKYDFSKTTNRFVNNENMNYISSLLDTMPDYRKAANLGIITSESGGNPRAVDETGDFIGLFQWEKGKRYSFPENYENMTDKELIDDQMNYYANTINNTTDRQSWTHGGDGSGYKSNKDALNAYYNSNNITDIVHALNYGYVRPKDKKNTTINRTKVANNIYNLIHK